MTATLDPTCTTAEMTAVFGLEARLTRMLAVEAALARVQGRLGLIPEAAVVDIEAACRVEDFDVAEVFTRGWEVGTPLIPMLARLRTLVSPETAPYLHWGATSQDIADTALMLQARDGLACLAAGLARLGRLARALAESHRATVMVGRTVLQPAVPITFGLKAATWLDALTRHLQRVAALRLGLPVQLGGAAGTLASLGERGLEVMAALARELGLAEPDLPWHTTRDRLGELGGLLGMIAATLAKLAVDVALLAQAEVGEVRARAGGSSTMPQKRNPTDAAATAAAARLALGALPALLTTGAEHERGLGGWHGDAAALAGGFQAASAALAGAERLLAGLEVRAEQMRANLERLGDGLMAESLSLALAQRLGRLEAHALVSELVGHAAADGASLREAASADPRVSLSDAELAVVFDPGQYLGATDAFIARAVAAFDAVTAR